MLSRQDLKGQNVRPYTAKETHKRTLLPTSMGVPSSSVAPKLTSIPRTRSPSLRHKSSRLCRKEPTKTLLARKAGKPWKAQKTCAQAKAMTQLTLPSLPAMPKTATEMEGPFTTEKPFSSLGQPIPRKSRTKKREAITCKLALRRAITSSKTTEQTKARLITKRGASTILTTPTQPLILSVPRLRGPLSSSPAK